MINVTNKYYYFLVCYIPKVVPEMAVMCVFKQRVSNESIILVKIHKVKTSLSYDVLEQNAYHFKILKTIKSISEELRASEIEFYIWLLKRILVISNLLNESSSCIICNLSFKMISIT